MSIYRKESGLGLIETMVSLFVLAIGLLGVSGLQSNSLKLGQNAYYRTQATNLAYDMIDRMRANQSVAKSTSAYESNYGQDHSGASSCSSSCTPAQIAAYDLMKWKGDLKTLLPKGQGEIRFSGSSTVRKVSVAIVYDESRGKDAVLEPLIIEAAL